MATQSTKHCAYWYTSTYYDIKKVVVVFGPDIGATSHVGSMQNLAYRVQDIHSIAELKGAETESESVEPKKTRFIVIHQRDQLLKIQSMQREGLDSNRKITKNTEIRSRTVRVRELRKGPGPSYRRVREYIKSIPTRGRERSIYLQKIEFEYKKIAHLEAKHKKHQMRERLREGCRRTMLGLLERLTAKEQH